MVWVVHAPTYLQGLQEGFLHQVCTPDGSVTCDFPFVCCLKVSRTGRQAARARPTGVPLS